MTGSASRLSRALAMAEEVHEGVVRKGTDIPYLAHVVGVSALVMEFGAMRTRRSPGSCTTPSRMVATPRRSARRSSISSGPGCLRSSRP